MIAAMSFIELLAAMACPDPIPVVDEVIMVLAWIGAFSLISN